jgi:serine/threonine protein kinase
VTDEGLLPDGSPYIVMPFAFGEGLHRMLLRVETLPVDEACVLVMRVASILHAVHAQGYVHRDVKPEHILLNRDEQGRLTVSLLDFGVCASYTAPPDEQERERGRVYGTPSYVSPEQATGNPHVDGRADVFALGVVLFECLVGRLPFRAHNVAALLRRIIREDAPRVGLLLSHVSVELDAVIARALAREADDRFPSPRALSRALAVHVGDRTRAEASLAARVELGEMAERLRRTVRSDAPRAA